MKKYLNLSLIYAVAAMICGVLYREITKWNGYTEVTALGKVHSHTENIFVGCRKCSHFRDCGDWTYSDWNWNHFTFAFLKKGRWKWVVLFMKKPSLFHVKKRTLLAVAGCVWILAGFNVARLGVLSYFVIEPQWYLYLLSMVVFMLFGTMFFKMSQKHTRRILKYEDYKPFWNFFDLKAYIIMACMMGGGIGFRTAGIFPDIFVAFFYSGLGCALALAGAVFFRNYISYTELLEKETTAQ